MFHSAITPAQGARSGDMALLLDRLAQVSTRPRYAFMLLSLLAEVADGEGEAGPFIGQVTLRDWLCDSLAPMGGRDPRRIALAARVRADLAESGTLPAEPDEASALIESELRDRVRASGKTNLSRAVSELVGAGLLRRYYAGYAVDHANRGGQRHAVYVLLGPARCLLPRESKRAKLPPPAIKRPAQGELRFG